MTESIETLKKLVSPMVSLDALCGCQFSLGPTGGDRGEWKVSLPGGITVVCPHGEVVGITCN